MRAAVLLALGVLATPAHAESPHVASAVLQATPTLRPGASATLRLAVTIKPGFHVQANPVLNPALIPIVLSATDTPFVKAGKPVYPAARLIRLQGSEEDLAVYDGTFVIEQPVSVSKDAPPGAATLAASLRYQACDDRYCLRPRTLPVELRVLVQ